MCGQYSYTSKQHNFSYTLNSCPAGYMDAEEWCASEGGHLTSYHSRDEQQVSGTGWGGVSSSGHLRRK